MQKRLAFFFVAIGLSMAFPLMVLAGWEQDPENSQWYYYSPDSGEKLTGWQEIDGLQYYLDAGNNGAMHTGWLQEGEKSCFFDWRTGAMKKEEFFCTCDTTADPLLYKEGDGFLYYAGKDGGLCTEFSGEGAVTRDIYYDKWDVRVNTTKHGKLILNKAYVLCDHYKEIQDDEYARQARDSILAYMNERNKYYKINNEGWGPKNNNQKSRQEKWEKEVRQVLSRYNVAPEWIDRYCRDVKKGEFTNAEEWMKNVQQESK